MSYEAGVDHSPRAIESERSLLFAIREELHIPTLEDFDILDKAREQLQDPWLADGHDLTTAALCILGAKVRTPTIRFVNYRVDERLDAVVPHYRFTNLSDRFGNILEPFTEDDIDIVSAMFIGLAELKEQGVLPHLRANLADIYDPQVQSPAYGMAGSQKQ